MRICLVSHEFAPFHGAGIGTYASLMAAAWAGAGHEVHVLTGAHPGVLEDGPRMRPGVRFHTVDPGAPGVLAGIGTWAERNALGVLEALERLHAQSPFDYIEFPDYGGEGAYATWARRAGALVGAVIGLRLHTPRRECRALNEEAWLDEEGARVDALEDGAIRRADVLISPSVSLIEMVRDRLGGVPGWPWEAVVPYPFDRDAVGELLPESGAPRAAAAGPPVVLFYGRLERRKGVHLLVEAARRMLESGVAARFRFIGGDTLTGPSGSSMRAHLERLAGPHAGGAIEFGAARPRKQLGEEIRRAAVVCVPSLWENFPNVVLESMALGACVVGSEAGGIGEIIRDGEDGLLFKAGDGADLERVLRVAIADEALRRTVGAAAPARIAEFCDPASVVAQTVAAVEGAKPTEPPREAAGSSVSVVVAVGDLDYELEDTIAGISAQGSLVKECVFVLRGGAGPGRAAWAAGIAAVTKRAGFEVRVLEPCGPGLARNAVLDRLRCEWVLVLEAGDVLEGGGLRRLAAAADPEAAWVGGVARWREDGRGPAPVGLDRDLLAAGAMPGLGMWRREAVIAAGGWDETIVGDDSAVEWAMACRLAAADRRWTLAPWVIASRPPLRGVGPAMGPAVMRVMDSCPGLAADPARVVRLLAVRAEAAEWRAKEAAAERARMVQRIAAIEEAFGSVGPPPGPRRTVHYDAVYRQRMMEGNLRYRIAERLNNGLRATGLQRPLKAMLSGARGLVRRIAGT